MSEVVEMGQKGAEPPVLRRVTQVPPIDDTTVKKICIDYFGLNPDRIDRLNSYDDKNYRLSKVASINNNPYLKGICADGYVLKITNAEDSVTPDLIEGQNALLRHLKSEGLPVPELVTSKNGKDLIRVLVSYSRNENEGDNAGIHAIRLMHFIPGQLLWNVPTGPELFHKVGHTLARVHNAIEDFRHSIFDHPPSTHWSLYHFGHLKDVLHAVEQEERREMITEIIEMFRLKIGSQMDTLQAGTVGQIHGDFNEQNILVRQNRQGVYDVCGLLDMGDSHRTCLVFDVAIAIVYMTMLDGHVPFKEVGGHFLAGYFAQRRIPTEEAHLLRLCMCARYSQSVVFGRYTYMQNPVPDNEYVLFTQKKGWPQLTELWRMTDSELYDTWRRILSSYGIENAF